MPQKSKLSAEEKVEAVRKYQRGEISLVQAARDAGVGRTTGVHGMKQKRQQAFYHRGSCMKQGRDTTQEERVQIAAAAASDTQKIRSILPKIFWTGSFMPQSPTRSGLPM